ncbi:MAG: NRDE family protein [Rhodovibrio sp.]|nr:NRDE family protein [Rhodovibrio sp.]
MCTAVLLRRPGHDWPLVLASNRDEMKGRPWQAPGRHWPDRPEVVGGLDELSGGSWAGVNDWGVVAVILNRYGSLGSDAWKRSRGELVLEALDHAEARAAAKALRDLEPGAYRSFNLLVADAREAYWLRNLGTAETAHGGPAEAVEVQAVPEGLSMINAGDLNAHNDIRVRRYFDAFDQTPAPDPGRGDWSSWTRLLADRSEDPAWGPISAACFMQDDGFGTLSSSLIALPAPPQSLDVEPRPAEYLFAPGPPGDTPHRPVEAVGRTGR